MQNPYITQRLAAEHQRQLLQETRTRTSYFQTGSSHTGSSHTAKAAVMNHVHFVRRTAGVVLAVCSSLFGFALFAPSAFGLMLNFRTYANGRAPSLAGARSAVTQPHPAVVRTVVAGGMSGWLITLIAVGAALLAATVAVLMDRARAAHRNPTVSAA
jgi:hypothetical protein